MSSRSRCKSSILWLVWLAAIAAFASRQGLAQPGVVGQWQPLMQWPVVSVHAHLLPNQTVLFWAYNDAQAFHIWDPGTNTITTADNPNTNLFCSGHSFLEDGRLIATGGHIRNNVGLDTAHIYDPVQDLWTQIADMSGGRWYPSTTTLSNGEVLVASGDDRRKVNQLPQVYNVAQDLWRDLTDAQIPLPLYPRTFLAPNGQVFFATATSRYLNTAGTGQWTDVAARLVAGRDNYGSACLYDDGKVLWTGGGDPPTETSEIIDLNSAVPQWTLTGNMAWPRRQNNLTILPDGTILATGGSSARGFDDSSGAVLEAELWDPATGTWTLMAPEDRYRGYHSTALLLPDGRVLSSGGDDEPNAQIFSPPYLFQGARPTISSVNTASTTNPEDVAYGEDFRVVTPDAGNITKVTLVRLGSLTHAQNWSQRILKPSFQLDAGDLLVTAPSDPNLAPPGYYMLFILNAAGVPSVAEMVRLYEVSTPCVAQDMGVDSVLVTTFSVGQGRKRGRAQVSVSNNCGSPVEDASVIGSFTGDIAEANLAALTNSSGVATLETGGTAKGRVQLTFCVDDVMKTGLTYNPSGSVCGSN